MVKKTYNEVKSHFLGEIEDKVVESDRDNDYNYEYGYYLLIRKAPAISGVYNGRWGWVVGR